MTITIEEAAALVADWPPPTAEQIEVLRRALPPVREELGAELQGVRT